MVLSASRSVIALVPTKMPSVAESAALPPSGESAMTYTLVAWTALAALVHQEGLAARCHAERIACHLDKNIDLASGIDVGIGRFRVRRRFVGEVNTSKGCRCRW